MFAAFSLVPGLLVPQSSGLLRSHSAPFSVSSIYGGGIRADDPEIDPRRKDPPSPGPQPGRFMPLPTVGEGDNKMDVLSRLLRDRARALSTRPGRPPGAPTRRLRPALLRRHPAAWPGC